MSTQSLDPSTPTQRFPGRLERSVVFVVISLMSLVALGFDAVALMDCWEQARLAGLARGLSGVGLGWMCGWYFTVRFEPTSRFLRNSIFGLAGHVVAMVASGVAFCALGLIDWIGADPTTATFTGITAVTFAPVAAAFATQLARDRGVHMLSGVGIGALSYVVLVGLPA